MSNARLRASQSAKVKSLFSESTSAGWSGKKCTLRVRRSWMQAIWVESSRAEPTYKSSKSMLKYSRFQLLYKVVVVNIATPRDFKTEENIDEEIDWMVCIESDETAFHVHRVRTFCMLSKQLLFVCFTTFVSACIPAVSQHSHMKPAVGKRSEVKCIIAIIMHRDSRRLQIDWNKTTAWAAVKESGFQFKSILSNDNKPSMRKSSIEPAATTSKPQIDVQQFKFEWKMFFFKVHLPFWCLQ